MALRAVGDPWSCSFWFLRRLGLSLYVYVFVTCPAKVLGQQRLVVLKI